MTEEARYVLAIYGSPRRRGNTTLLLDECLRGVSQWTSAIEKVVLRDLRISPCLEIYGCAKDGRCVIRDDFDGLAEKLVQADLILLASPIMFYTLSAHTVAFMDRCQSFWVKRHWLKQPINPQKPHRKGVFISVGATRGKRLFEGALLSARYFFDALDVEMHASLCFGGLDLEGDVLEHPEHLQQAYELGLALQGAWGSKT